MPHRTKEGAADILIPVHNRYAQTRRVLECIYRYADYPFQICVVDNASTDETVDLHKIYTNRITVVRNRQNRSWSASINQGIQITSNPYLVFLRNEMELAEGWLRSMVSFLRTHPRIGAVGALENDGTEWQGVDRMRETLVPQIPQFLTEDFHERSRILRYHFPKTGILVDGALDLDCAVFARRAVEKAGMLSDNGTVHGPDYCRRLRKAGFVLGLSLDTLVARNRPGQTAPAAASRVAVRWNRWPTPKDETQRRQGAKTQRY